MANNGMSVSARELHLFIETSSEPCYRMKMQIAKNLATKKARGIYKPELGRKAFMHLCKFGAQQYVKEFGTRGDKWNIMFPIDDRRAVAAQLEHWFQGEYKSGAFEPLLPKKYQKAATKKQACLARADSLDFRGRLILRALGEIKNAASEHGIKSKSELHSQDVIIGLNELVRLDLVTETTKAGARAWKLNECGRAVLKQIKKTG